MNMTEINKIEICGDKSPNIQPNFGMLCTELPNHEGKHRTVFSVNTETHVAIEYKWENDSNG